MRFTKMHGLGNDYVYINCFEEKVEDPSELSIKMSNRHFGIGSDGIILIMSSNNADFRMRMFNSDGSEAEMCGNGIRCVGKYVYDNKMTDKRVIKVETLGGIKTLDLIIENDKVSLVKVDMGEPILESKKVPVTHNKERVIGEEFSIEGEKYIFTCVSMGNPHAITYLSDVKKLLIGDIGPKIENHKLFPKRINAEFVRVISRDRLEMRVWERGAGETLACGTAACAVLVASVLNGVSNRNVTIELLGGELEIEWNKIDNHVYMTGPATKVFEGVW